jgi:endonuclease YncB( thermonuclease family)
MVRCSLRFKGRGGASRRSSRISPERWLRRRRLGIVLLILAIAAVAGYDHLRLRSGWPPGPPPDQRDDIVCYDGKAFRVTQAVDGDTLHIDVPDRSKPFTIVRLWGVDTPEVYGGERPMYFGPEASKFTQGQVHGRSIRLELVPGRTRDRYGRLLAYVRLPDGAMLNERLIAEGYAYADTRFAHGHWAKFLRLEEQARAAGRGLWAGVVVADMPSWRRGRQGRIE